MPLGPLAAGLDVPVLVKCEHLNPGGSVKDRIALAIVLDAERRGVLRPGDTIVEATAGNTGVGLALVAGARGYGLVCVMPEKMSLDKRRSLAALGARVEITRERAARPTRPTSRTSRGAWPPSTAGSSPISSATPRIRSSTSRRPVPRSSPRAAAASGPSWPVPAPAARSRASAGSCGESARAPGWCSPIRSAPGSPTGSRRGVAGPDTGYQIEGIGAGAPPQVMDRAVIDAAERISDGDSFAMVGRLLREEGLLVGGSAGTAVAAALRVARAGGLDGPVVAVLPDSWDRYLSTAWLQAL